ncbi:hypothetical protein T439DRAFT_328288 [Meredithblackwellia eburnea MCA 4105]
MVPACWDASPVSLNYDSLPPLPTIKSIHELSFGRELELPSNLVRLNSGTGILELHPCLKSFQSLGRAAVKLFSRTALYNTVGCSTTLDDHFQSKALLSHLCWHYSLHRTFLPPARPSGSIRLDMGSRREVVWVSDDEDDPGSPSPLISGTQDLEAAPEDLPQNVAAAIFQVYLGALCLRRAKFREGTFVWLGEIFSSKVFDFLQIVCPDNLEQWTNPSPTFSFRTTRHGNSKDGLPKDDTMSEAKAGPPSKKRSLPLDESDDDIIIVLPRRKATKSQALPKIDTSTWDALPAKFDFEQLLSRPTKKIPMKQLFGGKLLSKSERNSLAHLGDAYLELHMTMWFFVEFGYEGPRDRLNQLLRNSTFSHLALHYDLHEIITSREFEKVGIKPQKLVADIFEAYVGGLSVGTVNERESLVEWLNQLFSKEIISFH